MDKKEVEHFIWVLDETQRALLENDSYHLKDLSNQTIHSASLYQDSGSVTIAVLIYALSKLIERKEQLKIKSWDEFLKKFNSFISLARKALQDEKFDKYEDHLESARKALTSVSVNIKPYIQEVLKKASINKASKIYEHGISLGQTSRLLGLSQWELTDYIGQQEGLTNSPHDHTIDIKKRAKMALEFFS